ncbi:hypothetical protein SDC9_133131 [bioreactor metagenome]|uniref:Uncharacterized protein n=1 Tax=bioreactor metagenome TaxID=1076179 RepID=A0A645DAE9_9ZZZZ
MQFVNRYRPSRPGNLQIGKLRFDRRDPGNGNQRDFAPVPIRRSLQPNREIQCFSGFNLRLVDALPYHRERTAGGRRKLRQSQYPPPESRQSGDFHPIVTRPNQPTYINRTRFPETQNHDAPAIRGHRFRRHRLPCSGLEHAQFRRRAFFSDELECHRGQFHRINPAHFKKRVAIQCFRLKKGVGVLVEHHRPVMMGRIGGGRNDDRAPGARLQQVAGRNQSRGFIKIRSAGGSGLSRRDGLPRCFTAFQVADFRTNRIRSGAKRSAQGQKFDRLVPYFIAFGGRFFLAIDQQSQFFLIPDHPQMQRLFRFFVP